MTMAINVTSTSNNMDTLSRNELIGYVNDTLDLNYTKVEQMYTGSAYCQMLHRRWPQKVLIKKVKFDANQEHAFIDNWKILQESFKKLQVAKEVPIQRLVKGRFQDNFEFLQWFYKFYTINDSGVDDEYDPAAVRGHTGGATKPAAKRNPVKKSTVSAASAGSNVKKTGSGSSVSAENKRLAKEAADLSLSVEGLEKERDFYFSKLRDIEIICQEKDGDDVYTEFVANIIDVLHATEEGFGPVEDELAAEDELEIRGEDEQEEY